MTDIKLLVMDVDGTLTDGRMYVDSNGKPMKAFDVKDGYGIAQLLPKSDIIPAIITGNDSFVVTQRAKDLGIKHCYQGISNKLDMLNKLIKELNILPMNVAYIGDDLNDIECMRFCGYTACPKDAVKQVKQEVDYICSKKGGRGAVRELIDILTNND